MTLSIEHTRTAVGPTNDTTVGPTNGTTVGPANGGAIGTTNGGAGAGAAVDADLFRALLRRQASTVTVVTAPGPSGAPPAGFTATSFTSVSLRPPIVSFCLSRQASSWPTVAGAKHVAVHLLGEHQRRLAQTFATSGIDRFASPTSWRTGPYGVPILDGTLAWLLCRVIDRVSAGDHSVVLAEPMLGQPGGDGAPLVYHDGRYAGLLP